VEELQVQVVQELPLAYQEVQLHTLAVEAVEHLVILQVQVEQVVEVLVLQVQVQQQAQQEQLIQVVVVEVALLLAVMAVQAAAEQLLSHTLAHKYLQAEL
jgi:hypothetical protein